MTMLYKELMLSRYSNNDTVVIDKKLSAALIAQRLKQECSKRGITCTPCDIRNWTQMIQKSGYLKLKGL